MQHPIAVQLKGTVSQENNFGFAGLLNKTAFSKKKLKLFSTPSPPPFREVYVEQGYVCLAVQERPP
jgi:hypothetical protein